MQNIVYERKQNGEYFFSLPAVTYSRFGNCPANGLVTEQPQYSVAVCIFSTWQNAETKLISNGLRFIFTCPLFLAQPITFHISRHSFAKVAKETGLDSGIVKELLAHSNLATTERYMGNFDTQKTDNALINLFGGVEKPKDKKEEVIEALKGMSPEDVAAILSAIQK